MKLLISARAATNTRCPGFWIYRLRICKTCVFHVTKESWLYVARRRIPGLDVGAFVQEVGEGFFVFGLGGSLFLDGGEREGALGGAEALAGVGLDGLGGGEEFFFWLAGHGWFLEYAGSRE